MNIEVKIILMLIALSFSTLAHGYYGTGLGVSFSNPQLEGKVDDLTENEFGRVKHNQNTRFSYSGRLFAGVREGDLFGEVGYTLLGNWRMYTKDGKIDGEKSVEAAYGVIGWSIGPVDIYAGMHKHSIDIRLKQKTKQDKRNKERYSESGSGPLYGVRYNWKPITLRGEFWRGIGSDEWTGRSYAGVLSVGYQF